MIRHRTSFALALRLILMKFIVHFFFSSESNVEGLRMWMVLKTYEADNLGYLLGSGFETQSIINFLFGLMKECGE